MSVEKNSIVYEVRWGFWGHTKKTTDWMEAKRLLKNAIISSKSGIASLGVLFDDVPIGACHVTDVSALEKPIVKYDISYEDLIKKAIELKASASSINDAVACFIIDKQKAKISGDVRCCRRAKLPSGQIASVVAYTNENETKTST